MKNAISASEAARRLGVELNYLYILLRTKRLDAHKQDGEWLVSARAVEERMERLSK